MEDLSGKTIRGYELHELIGIGGFGAVYRATQTVVGREVVIKIILPQYASQPEFIRRFEAEAKLVARLEHLHIVSLYDYWREPSGAYLVMRFLRGGSLRDSLRATGAWTPRAAARLVAQMGAALTVAHRNNVIHRDVKPANILLDEENNAYLTDFGIAVDLVQKGGASPSNESSKSGVTGSAGYISPEQVQVKPTTARSDIYSMGVLMYELLTGTHPYHDAKSAIALFIKHSSEPLPPMAGFPSIIEAVLSKATAKDPEARYETMLDLAKAFREAVIEADMPERAIGGVTIENFDTSAFDLTSTGKIGEAQNPYKGLRAFQEGDADDFYGRESLIDRLVKRFDEDHAFARFLAVVGPSGSGKSSVVKAGLLPALRRGAIEGSDDWFIVEMVPGTDPLEELESALLRVSVAPPENLREKLAQRDQLASIVAQALPDLDSELVLVIDQFEEVFTQANDEESDIFLQNIYNAIIDTQSRLRVIITLRADFYDRPLMVQNFSALIQQRTEVVVPLTVDELERAITTPARAVKVFFQQGLSAQIVSEVSDQPGVLPMLQYALTELFERREGQLLTTEAYNNIGGVLGALARRAEEIYVDLNDSQQDASRQLFLRLVTLGEGSEDTRRRALQSELESAADDARVMSDVIAMYGQYRLLTFDRDPATRTPTVEVAHEALIREWSRLRDWLDSSRSDVRLQRMLANAAQEWSEAKRDHSFLLRGGRLIQFEEWAQTSTIAMTGLESDYLKESIAEAARAEAAEAERIAKEHELEKRARQRLRLIIATLGIASIFGIVLSIGIFNASQDAINNAATATFAQGDAIIQANNALTQAAIAATAGSEAIVQADIAETQAAIATVAQGEALVQANNAETQVALVSTAQNEAESQANNAETQAAIATFAQGDAEQQANIAQTQVALVSTAQNEAESQANIAETQAAIATFAQGDAEQQANIAQTQVALVSTAQNEAESQANIAETQAAIATFAQGNAEQQANIAQTQVALVSTAQNEAVLAQSEAESQANIAGTQAARAEIAQSNAEREAQIANSLVLAGSADQLADSNSPLALRLAIEANSIENPSLEVQRTLLDVVFDAPRRIYESRHGGANAIAMSADGTTFYIGSNDGTISQWDIETATELMLFEGHTDAITDIALNDAGTQIISVANDGSIILHDTATGDISARYENNTFINSVDFSPNGQRFVTGDANGNTIVRDIDGNELFRNEGNNAVNSVQYNDNSITILIASDDGARIWDTSTGRIIPLFEPDLRIDRIRSAVFAPEGNRVLTSGGSTTSAPRIWEWDTVRQSLLRELTPHNAPVNSVTYSPNGQLALSASDDFTLILSDAANGRELRRFTGHTNRVNDVAFTPDGTGIISVAGDGIMFLWDTSPSGEERRYDGHNLSISDLTYLDANTILSSADDGIVRIWDAESGDIIRDIRITSPDVPQTTIAVRPDTGDDLQFIWAATNARLYSVNQGATLQAFTPTENRSWISDVVISQDGKMLITGGGYFFRDASAEFTRTPLLYQWDIDSGAVIRVFMDENQFTPREGINESVTSLAFNPNERFLATGMESGAIYLWDTRNGELLQEYSGHSAEVTTLSFSEDGSRLLSGSGDRAILLWQVADGQLLRRYSGHTGAIRSINFSADETQIISGSEDTRIILWDLNTGQILRTFRGQDAPITAVSFTPDGEFALSGAVDGSMWLWGIGSSGDILNFANNNRYIPELTCNQREQYRVQPFCEVASDG